MSTDDGNCIKQDSLAISYTGLKKECNTLITPLPNPPRKRGGCATARVGLSVADIF
jgi:hypothetical protein